MNARPFRASASEIDDMKAILLTFAIGAGLCTAAMAQTPATTPAAVTATCKDGTDFSGTKRSGACRGHGGVKAFTSDATPAAATTTPPKPAAVSAPAPTTATTTPPAQTASVTPQTPAVKTPPPAGTAGQVWVNTASKVYHCPGTQYYGNTKVGEYMTEAAAKSSGAHADHGKACS
jgi:hypothetical protein